MQRPPASRSMIARRPSTLLALGLLAALAGCGGYKEKVTERIGAAGFWHLERAQTSRLWAWLNSIGFIARHLSDAGYHGERWWYVSPAGQRTFVRLLNGVAPDTRDGDPSGFIPKAVEQARAWGFTGLGFGVDPNLWSKVADTAPAVASLSLDKWSGGVRQGVFDPWYGPSVAKAAEALAGSLKDGKQVLGILWESQPAGSPRALLLAYAGLKPDTVSKKRLVSMVRDACRSDVRNLQARFPAARGFDDLADRLVWDQYEAIDQDAEAFARVVYSSYGGRVQQEVRDRFPNALNLGPMLDTTLPVSVIQSLAQYVDVLTFSAWTPDGRLPRRFLEDVYQATSKPVLVLDFGARLKSGNGPVVQTPQGMAAAYHRGFLGAAALPFVVGFGWTGYRDTGPEAWGMLDYGGAPREPLVTAATADNQAAETAHKQEYALPTTADLFQTDRFATERPSQGIGKLPPGLTINGDLADWPKTGALLKAMRQDQDLDQGCFATGRVGWTDDGLAVSAEVADATAELLDPRVWWRDADAVEVFVDGSGRRGDGYSPTTLHLVLVPRGGGPDGRSAVAIAVHHDGDALKETDWAYKPVAVASSLNQGAAEPGPWFGRALVKLAAPAWTIEALIPWSALATAPKPEARVGFNLIVRRIAGGREDGAFWAAMRGEAALDHPSTWGDLTLKEHAE